MAVNNFCSNRQKLYSAHQCVTEIHSCRIFTLYKIKCGYYAKLINGFTFEKNKIL